MVPIAFTDLVGAAASAGFDAVSVGAAVYRRALKDGLTAQDMRRILDDAGVAVSEVEGAGDWLTPPGDKPERWRQRVSDEELVELALSLGADNLLVTHFGTPAPVPEAAAAFAALCDQVADDGLSIALEFVAFATIMDLAGALEVVETAGRDNGGIIFDTWHFYRGHPDLEVLDSSSAARVLGVQVADGGAHVQGALEEDVLHRRLPGEGVFDLAYLLRRLHSAGVRASFGIEVWDQALLARGPKAAAQELYAATRRILDAAATAPQHQDR
ncbi:MAG: sugar phosphate isomerase/epimerase [Actinomycetota bacterium]|nr:sugar phosphate isomerase/epimerase [Actinomycetota bacterium]